jgi:hypothetical protein
LSILPETTYFLAMIADQEVEMKIIYGLLIALLGTPAMAQEIPNFDVETYCKEHAKSLSEYGSCKMIEQGAYDALTGRGSASGSSWAESSADARAHCLSQMDDPRFAVLQTAGGPYTNLYACLLMVAQGNKPFRR